jgi:hypothetical protein
MNLDRIDVQLPFPIYDPTIGKDLERTPTIVSLSNLQGLWKKLPFESHNLIT